MPLLPIALGLSLLGGLGGLGVAATVLLLDAKIRLRIIPWLVSYAVGALLGVSLLELLPRALESLGPRPVFTTLLAGILTFFVLEKLAIWRHCHMDDCDLHRATVPIVLIGDAAHNFLDGAVIGAAVLVSLPLGIGTAVAVLAHEIPHEVGDFAILLHAGYSRTRALAMNALAEMTGVLGAATGFLFVDAMPRVSPYFFAFATASFLYVAMADLIPDLHRGTLDDNPLRQVLLVAAGVGTVLLL